MWSGLKNSYAARQRETVGFIFASLLALSFFSVSFDAWSADAGVKNLRLACLSERLIKDVRNSPASGIRKSWTICEREFSNNVASLALTEKQKRVAFVSVLAYSMAPYGPSVSTSLGDLLKDKVLDCDNYAILFGHFSSLFVGSDVQIQFAGFDGVGALLGIAYITMACFRDFQYEFPLSPS